MLTREDQPCWVNDNHILTVFIWSEQIGELAQSSVFEVSHYEKQVTVKDPQDKPMILGQFNNWEPRPMHDLIDYCIQNDTNPPDFINELFEDEKIRNKTLQYMTDVERDVLHKKKCDFYKRNAMRKILEIVPFSEP